MITQTVLITFLVYLVAGIAPAIIELYLFRVYFLGGIWAAMLVGVLAAVAGGLIDTIFLRSVPDLVVLAGSVDIVWPLLFSVVLTTVYALISRSNRPSK